MIKNIVFDMGNVVIRFDPNLFMEREGVAEEDRQLLMREVYCSPEWSMMDRGSLTDEQAAEFLRPRKYVFETEWRTVDAVQIWSVGPDGIDNGGLRSTDDIRFILPIR